MRNYSGHTVKTVSILTFICISPFTSCQLRFGASAKEERVTNSYISRNCCFAFNIVFLSAPFVCCSGPVLSLSLFLSGKEQLSCPTNTPQITATSQSTTLASPQQIPSINSSCTCTKQCEKGLKEDALHHYQSDYAPQDTRPPTANDKSLQLLRLFQE